MASYFNGWATLNQDVVKKELIEIIGISAGICTSISLLPQLIKMIRTKKAEDISIFYLIILFCGLVLWIYYGVLREDTPIIATNTFSVLLNVTTLIMGIKYKRQAKNGVIGA